MGASKKKPKELAVITCVLVLAGLILWKKQEARREIKNITTPVEAPTEVNSTSSDIAPVRTAPQPVSATEVIPTSTEEVIDPSPTEVFASRQQKTIDQFSQISRVKIKLPTNLQYKELDFDENVAVLYAQHPIGKRKLAVLATKGKVNVDTALKFVNDSKSHLPIVRGNGFQISGAIQNVKAPEGSGLKNIQVLPGPTEDGLTTYAVHAERADGKGTYLFMMQDRSLAFEIESEFDAMIDTVKAE